MSLKSSARGFRKAPSLLRNALEQVKTRYNTVQARLDAITLPERFKGTIVEKWATYWKNLAIDYREMVIDTGRGMRDRPVRSTVYLTLLTAAGYSGANNPSERDFYDQFRRSYNELSLVHPTCQNPVASQHVTFLERCHNEGLLRRLSLGVVSFMWLDNYDKGLATYKAICPYLKPRYLTFHERIVDVGFNGRWRLLERKMLDYDINEENV
ncbi:mitochondrial import inner membrane translocase subunit Tim29 [Anopheles bellator]|uniref:mitochondrial import inner membrane translocase subunit Tim29 n=1 Tax=Anopheles bellator TaxID=139047 RepID=UPI0026495F3B|nr:mitochondrial import inner membrane translocase subunit Tim29 [Anopheles bellator]